MRKLGFVLSFSLSLILFSCNRVTNTTNNQVDIYLYESYNMIDLYPAFLNANKVIRKQQLDSLSKLKSGITLLDKMNADIAKSDTLASPNIDDFPFFKIFSPNLTLKNELKSSAMLGTTRDSATLLRYISLTDSCFGSGIKWKMTGNLSSGFKSLHAFKKKGIKIGLTSEEIDSVIVIPDGLNILGGVIEKISDLKGISEYWIQLKLNRNLISKLNDKTYSLIVQMNSKEFSGSVTDFSKQPDKYIMIGQVDNSDFEILRSKFEPIMKIKK